MSKEQYLLTEDAFHTAYLLEKWHTELDAPKYLIRANKPANLQQRVAFHKQHAGKQQLEEHELDELSMLYGEVSESELAMIARYGVPELPEGIYSEQNMTFLGDDLNSGKGVEWAQRANAQEPKPEIYIFLDQMLKHESWISLMDDKSIINAHSAILPYAPGMHSIELIAAKYSKDDFEKSVGATIHYIDEGVDTGALIEARSHKFPFKCESIWDVKGSSYQIAFDLLVELASKREVQPDFEVHTTKNNHDERLPGSPFTRKQFAKEGVKDAAIARFDEFKVQHRGEEKGAFLG